MKSIMKKPIADYLYKKGGNEFTSLDQMSIDLKCHRDLLEDAIKENPSLFEALKGFGDNNFSTVRLTRFAVQALQKNRL